MEKSERSKSSNEVTSKGEVKDNESRIGFQSDYDIPQSQNENLSQNERLEGCQSEFKDQNIKNSEIDDREQSF